MAFTVTADSVPLYDTFGSAPYWGCNEWINWHKEMIKKFGKSQADIRFADAWLAGLSVTGGGSGTAPGSGYVFDSVPIDCRTNNKTFRDYINEEDNRLLYDAVFSGVLGSTVGKGLSTGMGGVDAVTGFFNDVSNGMGKLKWILPILAVVLLIVLLFFIYKRYVEK
jgi:hypothetical protein